MKKRLHASVDEDVKEWAESKPRGRISEMINTHLRMHMDKDATMGKYAQKDAEIEEREQKRREVVDRLRSRKEDQVTKQKDKSLALLKNTPDVETALKVHRMGVTLKQIKDIVDDDVYKEMRKRRTANGKDKRR